MFLTFPKWGEEIIIESGSERDITAFPGRTVSHSAVMILGAAVLLGLVSVLWQHIAAVAATSTARSSTYGFLDIMIGSVAMGLAWTAWMLYAVAFLASLILVQSLKIWHEVVDDPTDDPF